MKVMITAYDYPTARIVEEVGVDYILVGDSLGMVVLGHEDTKQVSMQDMLRHAEAVVRGAANSFVIGDMPIGTYDDAESAVANARRFVDIGCSAVKIEGCKVDVIKALQDAGINIVGHLGLSR